ncbi:MAG: glycosyltransferase [Gammaproteobacteria bacterium]|nr:MAG: glycosyltransferase [Gammaproteobacteria bacterium]
MKIAYITSSLEGGGAQLPIPAVTRVLRNSGAEVKIFALTRRDGRALPSILEDGLPINIREGGDYDHWNAYKWLEQEIINYEPTLIWTSVARASILGIFLGGKYSIPVVCWQHNAYLKLSRQILFYCLRKQPVMWIGDSDIVSNLTAKRFKVPTERMATWPLFAANPDAPQAKAWKQGQIFRIGSLGRLNPQKSYDQLIKALVILKKRCNTSKIKFEIIVAGDGKLHKSLTKKAQQAGCKELQFIGFTEDPQNFLASLHLYLQCSNLEGFCISVHEAMQASLPIISTSVGQIPYTIESGVNGWLVPPNNAEALANALTAAVAKPEQLAKMGKAARAKVLSLYSKQLFCKSGERIIHRLEQAGIC